MSLDRDLEFWSNRWKYEEKDNGINCIFFQFRKVHSLNHASSLGHPNGDEIAGSDEFLLVTEEEELLHAS